MERYMLFHGDLYYPLGGLSDLKTSSDNLEELMEFKIDLSFDQWMYIYDNQNKRIILEASFYDEGVSNWKKVEVSE